MYNKPPYDNDRAIIEQLIKDGHSDVAIADMYGVSKDTIRARRSDWGLNTGFENRQSNLVDCVKTYWQNGYCVKEIANAIGKSETIVYNTMQRHGIRDLPVHGIDAQVVSLSHLKELLVDPFQQDQTLVVTYSKVPKWVLSPLDTYLELTNKEVSHG